MSLLSESRDLILHLCRSEEHTSELQSPCNLVCRLLLEKKNKQALDVKLIRVARPSAHVVGLSNDVELPRAVLRGRASLGGRVCVRSYADLWTAMAAVPP